MAARIISSLFFVFTVLQSCSPSYFEGTLIESYTLIVKADTTLNRYQQNQLLISDLRVKTIFSEGNAKEIIFDGNTGLTYIFLRNGTSKIVNVDTIKSDPIIGTKHINSAGTILGYDCDAFVLWTSTMKKTFFYNSDVMKINPSLFVKQKVGYINIALKEIGVLPLKIVEERENYIIVNEIVNMVKSDTIKINIPESIKILD